ncbi:GlmU family protein [Schleiferia thermophila]|jgi:UDP-N-acetylglucosamine diphosphorylase/glucosamine-1-phosphate N-acetyltransferase|uniref:UDP-N-acetylglucosamine diphosphorylase/glucosamine-1-phosphate N-acetyltransferase n=1 Tax=Schleiferia thermophila TaxID=884107 RepID=A0A369A6L6_9FLAO|nr:GlmU family protein [Schleiferia thermophila]PMB28568.1 glucose-1-phosphate thymidylyltransferase [Fischerella thermalis CCMEE 5319]RCX03976.1 UDP-N-acetylglucosamine diphosphorylase/glucosamine-1-phosphate N-acetyltransferase [Schleiferia thermophila]GCD80208.1 glucose-1-phosphate thymidylyltransferase [Schleiferia thermophila]
MNIILKDGPESDHLKPFTFTRPVSELRIGILTIAEKYQKRGFDVSYLTSNYLSAKYPLVKKPVSVLVSANVCPTDAFVQAIADLKPGEGIRHQGNLIASCIEIDPEAEMPEPGSVHSKKEFKDHLTSIEKLWHIFQYNGTELQNDFNLITKGRTSAELSPTNKIIGDNIFVEEGVWAECAVFNTKTGPIYIGKDATVMEGATVRGALALCEHSQLNMGAKIYGPTTVGPYCKVGGEVNNSVLFGYSNKGHEGFLGNSVLGEWCNIGADSNNSNLKNNYEEVKLWNYATGSFERTGLQFCGLFMGDHSKCGINTMFNTGTVVGVSANIFGSGFPRNFIPSFSWGGAQGLTTYKLEKALETASRVMARRGKTLNPIESDILTHVYEQTKEYR